jgi:hypothetical protein
MVLLAQWGRIVECMEVLVDDRLPLVALDLVPAIRVRPAELRGRKKGATKRDELGLILAKRALAHVSYRLHSFRLRRVGVERSQCGSCAIRLGYPSWRRSEYLRPISKTRSDDGHRATVASPPSEFQPLPLRRRSGSRLGMIAVHQ